MNEDDRELFIPRPPAIGITDKDQVRWERMYYHVKFLQEKLDKTEQELRWLEFILASFFVICTIGLSVLTGTS